MEMKTDKPPSGLTWFLIALVSVLAIGMLAFALGWVPEGLKDKPKEDLQGKPVAEQPYKAPTKAE